MKKFLLLSLLAFAINVNAQQAGVEKSIYGVQTGFLGIWAHNETGLSNKIALRTEIGFDAGISSGFNSDVNFVLAPSLNLEPRWYYNIVKRAKKGKNIKNNSANFLTLRTSFHPNWFVLSNVGNVEVITQVAVIPKWAIKRTIGSHFTYEAGIGVGYRRILNSDYFGSKNDAVPDLHIRLGYTF